VINSVKQVRRVRLSQRPVREPNKLPWPRFTDGGDPLGIDVKAKREDIIKIVYKYFKVSEYPMEELLQEVFAAILHKNYTLSAHNPTKSSFGHYVFMVANNVCINLVHKKKRFDNERESIDAPHGNNDDRSLLDTVETVDFSDDFLVKMDEVETKFRNQGLWDMARYIRATRRGAPSDIIREALSWGDRKITTKYIRDIRNQMRTIIPTLSD
jgi:hypothetical protein